MRSTTEDFRLNFNSLRPERLRLLLRRPLPLALLVALAVHGLALVATLAGPSREPARTISPAADAPQLLRLGRKLQAQEAALARAQRQPLAVNLPGLAALDALPPPPPPELAGAAPSRPARAAAAATSAAVPGWRWSSADGDLPDQPAQALELAQAWIPGSGSELAVHDVSAQEIRRRQLWLTPEQSVQLQRLWQSGQPLPAPFAGLPSGTTARRVPVAGLAGLGLSRAHGFSLVQKDALVLVWRDGQQLWLLRRPLDLTQP
jgi:hypothetical protein